MIAWLNRCWKCNGTGIIKSAGRKLSPNELTNLQYADQLVNGGWHAEIIKTKCPKCNGTGRKR